MPYITHVELAERPGPHELAQLASTQEQQVHDYLLMDATLRGLDRSAWTADDLAAADAALVRIDDAVAEADALINGFVAKRYTLPLNLPAASAGKSVLTSWCRAITRYLLNRSRISDERSDPVVRDYKDALRMLELLAAGKVTLGADDPGQAAVAHGTDVRFAGAPTVFGRRQLRSFR